MTGHREKYQNDSFCVQCWLPVCPSHCTNTSDEEASVALHTSEPDVYSSNVLAEWIHAAETTCRCNLSVSWSIRASRLTNAFDALLSLETVTGSVSSPYKRDKKLSYRRGTARRAVLVNSCHVLRGMGVRNVSNSNGDLKVCQGHWQWCHSIGHIRFPILVFYCNYVSILHCKRDIIIYFPKVRSRVFEHIPFGGNVSRMQ